MNKFQIAIAQFNNMSPELLPPGDLDRLKVKYAELYIEALDEYVQDATSPDLFTSEELDRFAAQLMMIGHIVCVFRSIQADRQHLDTRLN